MSIVPATATRTPELFSQGVEDGRPQIPVNDLTKHEITRDENEGRYLLPTDAFDDEPVIGSREATPSYVPLPKGDEGDNFEKTYRLPLKFNVPPKDPTKGYAFGTSQQRCDVVLASRGVRGTSRVHFHITFDVINGEKCLVLKDSSTAGTAVSYNGQARKEVRRDFTWILNLKESGKEGGEKKEEWEIEVHVQGLEFKVVLATHESCAVDYNNEVTKFLEVGRNADPPIGDMGIYSPTEPPSRYLSPGRRPVYISEGNIGKGSFGKVDKVIDVSTGVIYARKTFFDPGKQERERRLDQEIRIMKEHPHVSTAQSSERDGR